MSEENMILTVENAKVDSEGYYFPEKCILNITITPETPAHDSVSTPDASVTVDLDKQNYVRSLEFLDPDLSPSKSPSFCMGKSTKGRIRMLSQEERLHQPKSSILYLNDMSFVAVFADGEIGQKVEMGYNLCVYLDPNGRLLKIRASNIRNGAEYRNRYSL